MLEFNIPYSTGGHSDEIATSTRVTGTQSHPLCNVHSEFYSISLMFLTLDNREPCLNYPWAWSQCPQTHHSSNYICTLVCPLFHLASALVPINCG